MRISDWSSDVCSSDLFGTFSRKREKGCFLRSGDCRRRSDPRQLVRVAHDEHVGEPAVLVPGECHGRGDRVAFVLDQAKASVDRRFLELRAGPPFVQRSEEHTSELQSLMRISYSVFCLQKKQIITLNTIYDDLT